MAKPPDLIKRAQKIAAMQRSYVGNPFSRRANGTFAFAEMNEREGVLKSVHDVYDGLFGMYADPQAAQRTRPEEYAEQPGRIAINLLKLFVELLSVSYSEEPTRVYYLKGERVDQDDPIVEALSAHLQKADYNRLMLQIDRWMRLFGNNVVRPLWDKDNQELVFHVYPGYCIRVVENVANPRRPWATILLGYEYELGMDGRSEAIPTAEVWTDDTYFTMKGSRVTEQYNTKAQEFQYQFSPLVHCFDAPPFGGKQRYFVESPGWSMAQQNIRLNEDYFSQYGFAVLMQGIGILQVKGMLEGELVISPGRAIHFPNPDDASGLQSIQQNADLSGFQQAIQFMIDVLRESYGIPKTMLNAEVSSSGQAIIQASAPIAELRKQRQPVFSRIETELLRSTLQELRGRAPDMPASIKPEEWDVAVVYPDPQANLSVLDEIAKDNHLLGIGALTAAEIVMREKPGQFDTLEEAQKWVEENKKALMDEKAAETAATTPIDTSTEENLT